MNRHIRFLRIDDRLIHGQVIVAWLPELKPEKIIVVNDKIINDSLRQDMMTMSIPAGIDISFESPDCLSRESIPEATMVLVASPKDAWSCLNAEIAPATLNVGGLHARPGKEEIMEAFHVDDEDRKYLELIINSGIIPVFQPTPQNDPLPVDDIL